MNHHASVSPPPPPGWGRSLAWLVTVYLGSVITYTLIMFFIARAAGSREAMAHTPGWAYFLTNAAATTAGLGIFALVKWWYHKGLWQVLKAEWGPWFRWPSGLTGLAVAVMLLVALGSDWYLLEYQRAVASVTVTTLSGADAAARLLAVLLRTLLVTLLVYGSLVRSLQDRSGLSMLGIMAAMILVAFGLRYGAEVWHQCSDPSQAALALRFVAVRLLGWLLTGLGAAVAYKETASLGSAAFMVLAYQLADILQRL